MNRAVLARVHGVFNVASGLWPLVHMRSFERVSGPKTDHWLVQTVGGLLATNGLTQLGAGSSHEGLARARQIGLGTALTMATIDLVHASRGRISKVYLLDAVVEIGWALAWLVAGSLRCDCRHRARASDGRRRATHPDAGRSLSLR
jgi:hypothetical protein